MLEGASATLQQQWVIKYGIGSCVRRERNPCDHLIKEARKEASRTVNLGAN